MHTFNFRNHVSEISGFPLPPMPLISDLCCPRWWDPPPAGSLRHAHRQGEGARSGEGPGAVEIPADERLRGHQARGLEAGRGSGRNHARNPSKSWERRILNCGGGARERRLIGRGSERVWPVGGGGAGGEESKKGGAWKTKVGPVGVQGKLERGRKHRGSGSELTSRSACTQRS